MNSLFGILACLAVIVAGCGTDTKPVAPSSAPAAKIVTEETSTPETAASSTPDSVLARLKAGGKYTTVSTPLEAFVRAATAGDSASVASLAQAGINKEGQVRVTVGGNSSVRTALHAAAAGGHLVVVKYLVGQGASVSSTDANSATPLHAAVTAENLAIVQYLVGQGASVNAKDAWGETPLHYATAYGNSAIVTYLLGQEADVTVASNDGLTVAETADLSSQTADTADQPSQTAVKADLSRAARAKLGTLGIAYTARAFVDSARTGNLVVVKLFVQSGMSVSTEVEVIYTTSQTALHLAAYGGHLAVVKYLVGQRADVNAKNGRDETALHIAATYGYLELVRFLLGQGADVNAAAVGGYYPVAAADSGWTALHMAASEGRLAVVQCLVGQGADVEARTVYGETALHIAATSGYLEIMQYLVENGADVLATANRNWTVFHYALHSGPNGIPGRGKRPVAVLISWVTSQWQKRGVIDWDSKDGYIYEEDE